MQISAAKKSGEDVTVMNLSSLLNAASAAETLRTKSSKMKWSETAKMVNIIEKYGEVLPPNVAAACTRKFAESCLDAENMEGWLSCMLPWPVSAGDADEAWTASRPSLAACLDADPEVFAENFYGCFFNDLGLRLVMNVSGKAADSVAVLLKVVHGYLEAFADRLAELSVEGGDVPQCAHMLATVFQGFSAVLHSEPGAHGARPEHVNAIFDRRHKPDPDHGGIAVDALCLPASRAIISHIRDSLVWREMHTSYIQVGALEAMSGPELTSILTSLTGSANEPFNDQVYIWAKACERVPQMRKELRAGATKSVDDALLTAMRGAVTKIQEASGEWSTSTLHARRTALTTIRGYLLQLAAQSPEHDEFAQHLQRQASEWREADNKTALEDIAMSAVRSPTDVARIIEVLTNAKGLDITPAMGAQLGDLRGTLHIHVGHVVGDPDRRDHSYIAGRLAPCPREPQQTPGSCRELGGDREGPPEPIVPDRNYEEYH